MKKLLLILTILLGGCQNPQVLKKHKTTYPDYRGQYCPYFNKTIEVTIYPNGLGEFIACENETIVRNGPVSSGRPGTHDTIRGDFRIQRKYQKYDSKKYPSKNGSRNMDFAQFFYRGFAIHKGNIRARKENAKWIFNWSKIGTRIIVE